MGEIYPAIPKPQSGNAGIEAQWKTITAGFDAANEQRDSKWAFPKYNVTLKYPPLDLTDFAVLWAFYMARKGSFEAFWFYDAEAVAHVNQYVGVGDGGEVTFDIPGKSTSAQSIYLFGTLQSGAYTIVQGGGDGNSDRVTFDTAPVAGVLITASFTGYLRCRVRFADDKLSRDHFVRALYTTGINLTGLAPAPL